MESGARILPVVLFGHERLARRWWRLRKYPVTVRFGPLIEPPPRDSNGSELRAHTEQVMSRLAELLPPVHRGRYGDAGGRN
jgi:hypothetical protein